MMKSRGLATDALAAVGAASLVFASGALCKLLLALRRQSDFSTALLPSAPRGAFAGKVFWITGASSGVGRQLALRLASSHDDVKLILSSRRKEALEEVAAECRKRAPGGTRVEVTVLPLDLADRVSLAAKAKEALAAYGRVDVLVNNGGVSTRSMARNAGLDVDEYVAGVDYLSYVALAKALLPSWEKGDADKKPTIINVSSTAGKFGLPVRTSYCGAKFAILGWFDSFRLEQCLVGHPIDVLNIVLGSTRTNVGRNAVTTSSATINGVTDVNIEAGLDPAFVADRMLASALGGREEAWIAPRSELKSLYLNQYFPETARRRFMGSLGMQYAVEKDQKGE